MTPLLVSLLQALQMVGKLCFIPLLHGHKLIVWAKVQYGYLLTLSQGGLATEFIPQQQEDLTSLGYKT